MEIVMYRTPDTPLQVIHQDSVVYVESCKVGEMFVRTLEFNWKFNIRLLGVKPEELCKLGVQVADNLGHAENPTCIEIYLFQQEKPLFSWLRDLRSSHIHEKDIVLRQNVRAPSFERVYDNITHSSWGKQLKKYSEREFTDLLDMKMKEFVVSLAIY